MSDLIFSEVEQFFPVDLNLEMEYWQDDEIWAIINSYPEELKWDFLQLKQDCHNYFAGKLDVLTYSEKFLGRFTSYLSNTEDLEESFVRAGQIEHDFELEWYKYDLGKFWANEVTPFLSNYPYYDRIRYLFRTGKFRRFKIHRMADLFKILLEDSFDLKKYHLDLEGQLGLERAKRYCQVFFKRFNRVPLVSDIQSRVFKTAIDRGYWKDQSIKVWGDLLWESLGTKIETLPYDYNSRGG